MVNIPGEDSFLNAVAVLDENVSPLSIVDVDEAVDPGPWLTLGAFAPFLKAFNTEMDLFTGDPAARFECMAE
jgi:hypothetical protein